MKISPLLAIAAFLGSATAAWADISVNSAAALRDAVDRAGKGETILIAAGRYDLTDLKLPRDITLKGQGEVTFYSARPTEKGILNPLWGASLRVENIKFLGARAPDLNGAGIRHDGETLSEFIHEAKHETVVRHGGAGEKETRRLGAFVVFIEEWGIRRASLAVTVAKFEEFLDRSRGDGSLETGAEERRLRRVQLDLGAFLARFYVFI